MPFNGSGTFSRLYNWIQDAANGIKMRADRQDEELDGIATGLSNCITKDGQTTVTANLPMGGKYHTNVGNAVGRTNYASAGQVQDGSINWVDGGGTADAITATYSIPLTALIDGQLCFVRATAANATTTPTFSPSGLTARTITKLGGSALAVGDINGDNHELILRYNLANTRWELLNPAVSNFVSLVGNQTVAGDKTFSGNIILSGSQLRQVKGADVASASTLPLISDGNFFDVTGTTTITSFAALGVGTEITLQFDGILTLTHSADLILPTALNITTVAGDTATFREYAAGDWVCVGYNKANGRALKERDINIFSVRDEKAAGTNAGTFTSGAWQTRTLNDELENTITGASLSSNQIILPAGTYRVTASAPASLVINHQARLYNITDGATVLSGTPEITWSSNTTTSRSMVVGTFTIAGSKTFELQHRCSTTAATYGFGQAANFGEAEIYSYVIIEQV